MRLERVTAMVRATAPTDLVVLPELWRVGYNNFAQYKSSAEPVEGSTVAALRPIAIERGCYIHAGSIVESGAGGRLRNTAVLIGPDGGVVHRYSKVHVFGYASKEKELLEPGDEVTATATAFGTVAATTCYDLRFPGLWTELVAAGARIVIVPAAWPAVRLGHWRLLTAARAVDNQVFVVACNAAGRQQGVELGGHSRVVDPGGVVVAEAGAEEEVCYAEIDPALADRTRAEFPVLADRVPDYRLLRGR